MQQWYILWKEAKLKHVSLILSMQNVCTTSKKNTPKDYHIKKKKNYGHIYLNEVDFAIAMTTKMIGTPTDNNTNKVCWYWIK